MDNKIYKVFWKENEVGVFAFTSIDMWYIEGGWTPLDSPLSIDFENALKAFDPKLFLHKPEMATRVVLQSVIAPSVRLYCLANFFEGNILGVRQLVAKETLDAFFPNR